MKQLIQKVLLDMIFKMYLIGYNYSEAVNSESSIRSMIFKMYLIGYNYSEAVNSESSIRHDIQDVLNWI